jgi:hypothetical protein
MQDPYVSSILEFCRISLYWIKRRRPSRRRPARSGTPCGRAAWAPVPPAVPIGRPAVLRPPPCALHSDVVMPAPSPGGDFSRPTQSDRPTRRLWRLSGSSAYRSLPLASGGGLRLGDGPSGLATRGLSWVEVEAVPSPPPTPQDKPSRPGHGGEGRSVVECSTFTTATWPASRRVGRRRRG